MIAELTTIDAPCFVVGQYHCAEFYQLLHEVHNSTGASKRLAWNDLNYHMDHCRECQTWQNEPQKYGEDE